MDKDTTEKMRELLLAQKREILEALIATNADFRAIVEEMDPKDFADVASDDIDRKMIEALGSQDIKRLRAIDAALSRINLGRYGSCMKCNKKIPRSVSRPSPMPSSAWNARRARRGATASRGNRAGAKPF